MYSYSRTRVKDAPIRGSGPYEAMIVNHLDPYMQGSLEVELLRQSSAANTPERSGQLVVVKYLSPFYGVTPASGLKENDGYENTQKSYGFWAVPPDFGTRVLVIFAEGNPAYGYWIGCIQDNNMNFMVPDGRASTTATTDATPGDLQGKKLPVGEYNKKLETGAKIDPNFFDKPYNKDFTGVLTVQGLLDDEARGTTTTSSRREVPSMVFGMSTPGPLDKRKGAPKAKYGESIGGADIPYNRLGGSSFVMDDGDDKFIRATHAEDGPPIYINRIRKEGGGDETIPQNELTRIRTRTGHQILLHNSEDLIYIGNSRGTAWIELTSDGKIDIHAQDSISVMSDNDINFTAERDFNVDAGRNVNIKASARWSDFKSVEEDLESGRVQIESAYNTNLHVGRDHKVTVKRDRHLYVENEYKSNVGGSINIGGGGDMMMKTAGSVHTNAGGSVFTTSDGSTHNITAGNVYTKVEGKMHVRAGESIQTNAGTDIHTIAGNNMYTRTITGAIHTTAETAVFNETILAEPTNGEILGIHNTTPAAMFSNALLGINSITPADIRMKADTEIHLQGGSLISGDASEVHWNSGKTVDALPAIPAEDPVPAEFAFQAEDPKSDAEPVKPLPTITLPYVMPGVDQPIPYPSILARAPQHEPWPHHENYNPLQFKRDQTDREATGALVTADRFQTPDTFLKGKTNGETTVRVMGTGGNLSSQNVPEEGDGSGSDYRNSDSFDDSAAIGEGQVDPRLKSKSEISGDTDFGAPGVDKEELVYENRNATRNLACDPILEELLIKVAKELQVKVHITSGGQMPYDECIARGGYKAQNSKKWYVGGKAVRTGSVRHDGGAACDLYLTKDGIQIPSNNPIFNKFVELFMKNGGRAGGSSPSYMGPYVMHLDIVGSDRGGGVVWLSTREFERALRKGLSQQTVPLRPGTVA